LRNILVDWIYFVAPKSRLIRYLADAHIASIMPQYQSLLGVKRVV